MCKNTRTRIPAKLRRNLDAAKLRYAKRLGDWESHEKKTTHYREQDPEKVAAYQEEISGIAPEQIAYVDETGIDTYLYREYGYAPKGQKVHAAVSGRKYKRVGIVAAQLGREIVSPLAYSGTMDGRLFLFWFEHQLLPALFPLFLLAL